MTPVAFFEPSDGESPSRFVLVSPDNPLPVTGGGGMLASDIVTTPPLVWDTSTMVMQITPLAFISDATDPEDMVTKFNSLLADMRDKGQMESEGS